ncbi:hypothetical protein [Streptosporangium sp. NPDC048865]|uniref:hypothetical protein n=1 Tax=Streptosporangium sp. NPDC048865 TaxID=3155766 RepID=UPI0034223B50
MAVLFVGQGFQARALAGAVLDPVDSGSDSSPSDQAGSEAEMNGEDMDRLRLSGNCALPVTGDETSE